MIYILLMILLFWLSHIEQIKKDRFCKFIFLGIFFSLSAFRYKTGLDWIGYVESFDLISKGNFDNIMNFDIGYVYLMKIFNLFHLDYYCMQIFISLLCVISIFIFFYDNSEYPLFCLAVYFSTYYLRYSMGVQRQAIALSFCLFSFYYYKRNKTKSYLIFWIIAISFHFSAITFFIVYLERYFNINYKKQIFIILIIIFFLGILRINIINIGLNFLEHLFKILNLDFISDKISDYSKDKYYSGSTPLRKILIFKTLIILFIYLFYKTKDKSMNYLCLLTTTYITSAYLSLQFNIFDRLEVYFGIFAIVLFSYIFDIFKFKRDKFIISFLLCLCFIYPNINLLPHKKTRYYFRYIPYYHIFNKKDDIQRLKAELGEIK